MNRRGFLLGCLAAPAGVALPLPSGLSPIVQPTGPYVPLARPPVWQNLSLTPGDWDVTYQTIIAGVATVYQYRISVPDIGRLP